MKKSYFILALASVFALTSCNNNETVKETSTVETKTSEVISTTKYNELDVYYTTKEEEEITLPAYTTQEIALSVWYSGRYDIKIEGDLKLEAGSELVNGACSNLLLKDDYRIRLTNESKEEKTEKISFKPSTEVKVIELDKSFIVRIDTKKSMDKKLDIFFDGDVSFEMLGEEIESNHIEILETGKSVDLLIKNNTDALIKKDLIIEEKELTSVESNKEYSLDDNYGRQVFKLDVESNKHYNFNLIKGIGNLKIVNGYNKGYISSANGVEWDICPLEGESAISLSKISTWGDSSKFIIEDYPNPVLVYSNDKLVEPVILAKKGETFYFDLVQEGVTLSYPDTNIYITNYSDKIYAGITLKYNDETSKWELKIDEASELDWKIAINMYISTKNGWTIKNIYVDVPEEYIPTLFGN